MIGNESLYKASNGNGIRLVNLVTSKNLIVEQQYSFINNILKTSWVSPDHITLN